jgi:hypothetical protein
MKIIAFGAAALSLIAVAACTQCKEESNSRIVTTNTATLDYKECVTFQKQGLTLCFESANEYRCPCYADCLWEGACDIKFKLTGTDLDSTFSLSYVSSGPAVFSDSIAIGNAIIRVAGIVPTDCNDYADYEKYKVDVGVE